MHVGQDDLTPSAVRRLLGPGAIIGHLCMVHAATIGEEALVGNASTVLDGARIGDRKSVV